MYQSHLTSYFLDGRSLGKVEARLAFGNSGFLFGESVFTTAAVWKGQMSFFAQHLQRLQNNWRWLFDDSLSEKELTQFIKASYQAVSSSGAANDWRLRINIFKDEENRSRCLTIFTPFSFEERTIKSLKFHDGLLKTLAKEEGVKQPNYSEPFRHRRLANCELLFVDDEGGIGESATGNVIFSKKGKFVSPKNEKGIFQGIGLKYGLANLDIDFREIHKDEVLDFSGAWLVNSLRGVQKVAELEGHELPESETMDHVIRNCFEESKGMNQEQL